MWPFFGKILSFATEPYANSSKDRLPKITATSPINGIRDSYRMTLISLLAESEVIERAWRVIEEALENCPEALISTFQVSCWGFADKALLVSASP